MQILHGVVFDLEDVLQSARGFQALNDAESNQRCQSLAVRRALYEASDMS
jgi:hypothetical protein